MVSQATGDGQLSLTVTFALGTDLDIAQVLVQNRVAIAEPRLPEEVRRIGVTVRKNSPDLLMVIHLSSPDGSRDQLYISNYATLQIRDVLARLDGVGDVRVFGARDYSMRIWLDPDKVAARNLTAGEVRRGAARPERAGRLRRAQPAAGARPGRLPAQRRDARPPARRQGVREHRGQDRAGRPGHAHPRHRPGRARRPGLQRQRLSRPAPGGAAADLPAARARTRSRPPSGCSRPWRSWRRASRRACATTSSTTRPSSSPQSVDAVIKTIYEAVVLVVIVVILFLQTWRASIIPIVAIPVSLIGTFAVLAAFGYSLNNLSLFGLVLAIGIVVDDAIVVVENVERNLALGMSPREAAHRTMDEVGGALIAIALVLGAVFIPAAFIPGISGQFFRQFAVTIAAATAISCFVSLTLSPALCALLFKPHAGARRAARRCCSARCTASSTASTGVRQALARLRRADPTAGAADRGRARGLCRPDRADRLAVRARADRLHPAAGPGLSDHRDPAAARRLARPHRRGRAARDRDHARHAGRDRMPCRSPASTARPSPTRPTPARSSRR